MKVCFTVPGEPQGKGRPKFSVVRGRANARTPDATVVYENLIRVQYRLANAAAKFDDGLMLDLRVAAYYSIPVSASRKKKAAMESGEIRPTKKPDADNILKVVADALNKIAYHDDAQVVDARVQKSYSRDPRLEVSIEDVECIF